MLSNIPLAERDLIYTGFLSGGGDNLFYYGWDLDRGWDLAEWLKRLAVRHIGIWGAADEAVLNNVQLF